jgi:hypothetical protein
MADTKKLRTCYPPEKYISFMLVFGRWIRLFAQPHGYKYVTLGGTELRDIQMIYLIDPLLVTSPTSFEDSKERYPIAVESAEQLKARGCVIQVIPENVFEYTRNDEDPHIFFFDTLGIFAWADYHERLGEMFQDGTIRQGDLFLVTSHLGHNPGWAAVYKKFDGEYRLLKISDTAQKQLLYRRAHPSFTVYKALAYAGMTKDLSLTCIGCVGYFGSSPMGVWGYIVRPGSTNFLQFINDALPRFVDLKEAILL